MKLRRAVLGLLGLTCTWAGAATFTPPPPIDQSTLPVLIYSESEYGKEAVNVYLAHKDADQWKRNLILSAPFVAVEQLGGSKYLVAAGPSEQESELYLTDFLTGTAKLVTTRKGMCPIAFPRVHERYYRWKEAYKAFLIQDSPEATDVEFITVDFGAMNVETINIPKTSLGPRFGADTHLKIGPNGAHLAYMSLVKAQEGVPRAMVYQLNTFHFADKTVSVTAPNIVVQVSSKAPVPFGVPPFSWWDWENLIWGEIDPSKDGDEANITFFKNDVHKENTTPLFSQRIALTETGGDIYRASPLLAEIVYRPHYTPDEEYLLNFETNALELYTDPTRLHVTNNNGDVQVTTPTRLLFHREHFGKQILDRMSARWSYIAYSLSTGPEAMDADRKAELYVNLDEAEAERVAGPVYYCRPLGWVEKPIPGEGTPPPLNDTSGQTLPVPIVPGQ